MFILPRYFQVKIDSQYQFYLWAAHRQILPKAKGLQLAEASFLD